jgi:hypothetical protein
VDLNTVIDVVRQPSDRPGADWRAGDAWLAGGTWPSSDPQPTVHRLVDLTGLGWPSVLGLGFVLTEQHLVDENGVMTNPVAPALANAVHDATGVRYRELPLTPDRIFAALQSSGLIPTV